MKRYQKLDARPRVREEEILRYWEAHDTFAKTLEATQDGPRYVFYEGPPTANGQPHFGHLMPRVYKDLFPRYKTMQGHYVGRRAGWDTHGLPVELEVEKAIGVDSKPEIEAYGVERFVERCKESVWRYKSEWERMMRRMGFWIDFDAAYVTYTDDYIETVWWELKTMFDRGFLYPGHKTLPYCPRCGTGLSSHEVAQGYRTVEDPSVTVRMPVTSSGTSGLSFDDDRPVSLLTWTTTPWTLPANVALAVASDAEYVEVDVGAERFVLVKELADRVIDGPHAVLREFRGKDLVGVRYRPPYELTDDDAAHQVYEAGFVNLEDGTGIVHIASAFGEDDYQLGQSVGLPFVQPVDLAGKFTDEFPLAAGEFVKDADERILADLEVRGLLLRTQPYEHEYPFCWRCDTPLLYFAVDSWYIRTTAVKDELIENNRGINWYPAHVGEGRLGDFLSNLKDWALSRDRYWGTPLNLWVCGECGQATAIGSRDELVERAADPEKAKAVELHRPYVDGIAVRCAGCGGEARRVPYVIDTWFDSGSMHTAQWHYPFENKEKFLDSFPADFICEAMEQTRGWFYTLLATATIIHGKAPFRNCIGTGLGLDENGLKMSKSKGNVLDPWEAIDQYGADCIRWYLYSSSAPWKSKRLGEAAIQEPLYKFLDTVRNTYDFFALYASIDGYDPAMHTAPECARTVIDRWVLSRLASTTRTVVESLEAYDVVAATGALESFVDAVSNWYVRLCRRRFWKGGMGEDKVVAYATLRRVLMTLSALLAPFTPFLAEAVFRQLRTPDEAESVHLCRYPAVDTTNEDPSLEEDMAVARRIAALCHQARNQAEVKVRQPLARMTIEAPRGDLHEEIIALLQAETNVEVIETVGVLDDRFEETPIPNFRTLGPRLGALGQKAAAWVKTQPAKALQDALANGAAETLIDGATVRVLPEDVTFEKVQPEGFVLTEDADLRVLLDTRVDDRLRERGVVREVVHRIQIARKEAGFDVTDRICLSLESGELSDVLRRSEREVASEVLASEVRWSADENAEFTQEIDVDGKPVRMGIARVKEAE